PRNGDDERHDHDGQNDSSGEEAHSVVRALEKLAEERNMAESVDQNRPNGRPHKWYDDKDSEKAIDHAGHRGEQVNQERYGVRHPARRKFGEENRSCE